MAKTMQKSPKLFDELSRGLLQPPIPPLAVNIRPRVNVVFHEGNDRLGAEPSAAERGERVRRRRRRLEAAESEILDAAEAFLSERPFREMTIYDVMSRTGLSRPSFYEYFRDRHHLMIKLTEWLGNSIYSVSERWLSRSGPGSELEELKASIDKLIGLYMDHGSVLRALADAATHDRQVEAAYRKVVERFIEATAARIRAGFERGTMKGPTPRRLPLRWCG